LMQIAQLAQSYGFVPIGVYGKIPRFKGWPNVRFDPNDPGKNIRRIGHLYDAKLVNNVAILTGAPSGVVVVDVDAPSLAWWNELVRINGGLPPTFTVQTGSGGRHYYFRYDAQNGMLGNMNKIFGQDIDYRTNGGIVLFPGSQNQDTGQAYLVESGYLEGKPLIAPMPSWLLSFLYANSQR
jgi:hypothetical protein